MTPTASIKVWALTAQVTSLFVTEGQSLPQPNVTRRRCKESAWHTGSQVEPAGVSPGTMGTDSRPLQLAYRSDRPIDGATCRFIVVLLGNIVK